MLVALTNRLSFYSNAAFNYNAIAFYLQQHQSGKGCPAYHAYRADAHKCDAYEAGDEDKHINAEIPRVKVESRKVLFVEQPEGYSCKHKSYHCRTQSAHNA